VTLLAAAVLVLLPALAWLQYSWLDQIADADRERRVRTLQTAAAQLVQDFDAEIGRAVFALQIDSSSVDQGEWSGFAQKYQVWAASAASPRIVKSIHFADAPGPRSNHAAPSLRVWNTQTHTFDETPWPEDLASVRTRFVHEEIAVIDIPASGERRPVNGSRAARMPIQRMLLPPTATGDDQSIVMPVMRIASPGSDGDPRPDVTLLGFTILRFDLEALGTDVLPGLVRRHFYDEDGETEFAIAVVSRENAAKVIFEAHAGAAGSASAEPDATASLLGPRMGQFMFMARGTESRRVFGTGPPAPPPPPPPSSSSMPARGPSEVVLNVIEAKRDDGGAVSVQRATVSGDGQWRLVAKHRAGSLEAAVAAARTRNFALSSGILALLGAAIGLIVVSARRADRLARQ